MNRIINLFVYFLVFFGLFVVIPSLYEVSVFCSFGLFLYFARKIYCKFSGFSLSFLFLFFFGLYGYCIPLSVIWGLDIGAYRLNYISTWDQIDDTLVAFSLINHIALVGMIIAYLVSFNKKRNEVARKSIQVVNLNLFSLACVCGVLSSLFEFVNFLRVGGISTLFSGKLVYQSSQADIGLILPSEIFFYISIAAFAYTPFLKCQKLKKLLLFFLSISFYVAVNLIIGERGTFVNGVIMFLIGSNFYSNRFKIKSWHVLLGVVIYLVFAVVTVYRSVFDSGAEVSFTDAKDYVSERGEVLTFVLNPANSEFCTSTLNYRVFLDRHRYQTVNYKYGQTYLHFYSQLLPQKINPLYDVSETVKFRDKYFPERAKGGSTGGTAYSSLYEAYINWWYFGGLITYFIVFYIILLMERFRLNKSSIYLFFVYVLSFELILLFHRSAFEYIIIKFIAILFYAYLSIKLNGFICSIKKYLA